MRVNKFVASSSNLSRRAADTAVAAGRVKIDGAIAPLGQTVKSQNVVTLDDVALTPLAEHTYLMLNKPAGYISSRARQSSEPTLYELIPKQFSNLRIAGRLDRNSSGLILLSDDGTFIQGVTHPSQGKTKQYELTLSAPLSASQHSRILAGIPLQDGLSFVTILSSHGRSLVVNLSEGRNRQIRRTFGALGLTVERLHRTRMGKFELGDIPSGSWRELDAQNVKL
jgi:23S rRNA pseudouridine2605 synthase